MARPLPYSDVHALFDVVVNIYAALFTGSMPPDMVSNVTRRMVADGFLPADASAGELAAAIGDLVQRLHYAMGSYDVLPAPSPREVWHSVSGPTEQAGAACRDAFVELGSPAAVLSEVEPDGWEVLACFLELPPDSSFDGRVMQLEAVAQRHGDLYTGSQG